MQLDFVNLIELQDFAEIMRRLRAAQIADNGGQVTANMADLRDAVNQGVREGRITTRDLEAIRLQAGGELDATTITSQNVKKGMVVTTNPITGEVEYNQTGFNNTALNRRDQAQFNNPNLAARRLSERSGAQTYNVDITHADGSVTRENLSTAVYEPIIDGSGRVTGHKLIDNIVETYREFDQEANAEMTEVLDEAAQNATLDNSGVIAVDSSWINTIEHEAGSTTVQTYSNQGTRLYTYPDAAGNAFNAMEDAHESGGSVGQAWWDEVGNTGLKDVFRGG